MSKRAAINRESGGQAALGEGQERTVTMKTTQLNDGAPLSSPSSGELTHDYCVTSY